MGSITKGLAGKQDSSLWDGTSTKTFTRDASSGYTLTLNQFDWVGVDVLQVYGGGVNRTRGTINNALSGVGSSNNVALFFSPGTWTITDDLDLSSYDNLTFVIPPGTVFNITSSKTLTFPVPENIMAGPYQILTGISGYGVLRFARAGTVYSEWWGAAGDGTTNDTAAINAAVTAMNASGGGCIQFLGKIYLANVVLQSSVMLRGVPGGGRRSHDAGVEQTKHTVLKANATGNIVGIGAASTQYEMDIQYISFLGLGAGTAVKGINIVDANRVHILDCFFDNISDQAIYHQSGVACQIHRCFAQNCMLDHTQAAHVGVVQFQSVATDNMIRNCEFGSNLTSKSDANLYINGLLINGGGTHFVSDCVFEYCDTGVRTKSGAVANMICNTRCDNNAAYGFYFDSGSSQVINCLSLNNSRDGDNSYDGFYTSSNAANMVISNCFANVNTGNNHRYGFYDNYQPATRLAANKYNNCHSYGHQTGWFGSNDYLGCCGGIPADNAYMIAADADTTPSVAHCRVLQLANSAGCNITDFDENIPGQEVILHPTNGNSTIVHDGVKITTETAGNITLTANKLYKIVSINGVWYLLGHDT